MDVLLWLEFCLFRFIILNMLVALVKLMVSDSLSSIQLRLLSSLEVSSTWFCSMSFSLLRAFSSRSELFSQFYMCLPNTLSFSLDFDLLSSDFELFLSSTEDTSSLLITILGFGCFLRLNRLAFALGCLLVTAFSTISCISSGSISVRLAKPLLITFVSTWFKVFLKENCPSLSLSLGFLLVTVVLLSSFKQWFFYSSSSTSPSYVDSSLFLSIVKYWPNLLSFSDLILFNSLQCCRLSFCTKHCSFSSLKLNKSSSF